jgi:hypothetical protein
MVRPGIDLKVGSTSGTRAEILPGKTLNFDCRAIQWGKKEPLISGKAEIAVTYTIDLFGILSLLRHSGPTLFTWFGEASNPQWIRGDFDR